jgi:methylthioribose-1-phosphate isomerase
LPDVEPIRWTNEGVVVLDQRRLPAEICYNTYTDYRHVARAIHDMEVRGAPAIGIAAAMGVALGVQRSPSGNLEELRVDFQTICSAIADTRPTALDLFRGIERLRRKFEAAAIENGDDGQAGRLGRIRSELATEANNIHRDVIAADQAIGRFGAALIPDGGCIMTQCNTGALATGGIGTALGVIRVVFRQGKQIEVLVPETRPYLQGARLTAWELHQEQIPLTLITDNMVGHFMKTREVKAVIVGADRIAPNGDTANKIGTYQIAVLAREHGVPFYVAAPVSTIDFSIASGEQIPIEERSAAEVTHIRGVRVAPDVRAAHPAFDVTPARLITSIITEHGVARAPYTDSLRKLSAPVMARTAPR